MITFDHNNKIDCSCGLFLRGGIICRHMFKLAMSLDFKNLDSLPIKPRWTITYDNCTHNNPNELEVLQTRFQDFSFSQEILINENFKTHSEADIVRIGPQKSRNCTFHTRTIDT